VLSLRWREDPRLKPANHKRHPRLVDWPLRYHGFRCPSLTKIGHWIAPNDFDASHDSFKALASTSRAGAFLLLAQGQGDYGSAWDGSFSLGMYRIPS
jgi:hypothetical protein